MKTRFLLAGTMLLALTTLTAAAAKLGDPAAALVIKDWVKGKAVDVKDGKNVYVVEFWATWCGPCKTSIPHLTEMQTKFKDKGVVFIGISDEPATKVKPFVDQMADKMGYTVACDNDRKSTAGYMEAYGQGGIPTAFIVGKSGQVLWFGHPMADLEKTLELVVAGKYDIASAVKKDEARAAMDEYTKLAASGDAKAQALGRKVLAGLPQEIDELVNFAFGIAANGRNPHRDFTLAGEALDQAQKLTKTKDARILGTRSIVLFESGQEEEGVKLAREAVAACTEAKDKPRFQQYVNVMEARLKQKKAKAEAPDAK